eukprot:CAMPEP_0172648202 /NCGR_PEP_ID=MMETSP1068-20121228/241147_1 /TAXON_ID=35684 /ORGANISM="Pseudopedinella elastica, Strain CCMP716" /LENGTH=228 /DNA_ID=CAMNT_0013462511 /DNA_START=508 /DNA_END=1195 /DNA_ORIENTATION=+
MRFLVNRGANVLAKNHNRQTPYDISSSLTIRQFLLPLQLKTESELGLAPVIPGATRSPGDVAANIGAPPPAIGVPPPMSAPPAAPPPTAGAPPTQPSSAQWQPPQADGFKSGNAPVPTRGAPPPPVNFGYNQFSAFNSESRIGSAASRYVTYNSNPIPQDTLGSQQPPASYPPAQPPAYVPPQQPPAFYSPAQPPVSVSPQSNLSPNSAGGDEMMEEVSLSATSSSVM